MSGNSSLWAKPDRLQSSGARLVIMDVRTRLPLGPVWAGSVAPVNVKVRDRPRRHGRLRYTDSSLPVHTPPYIKTPTFFDLGL